MILGKFIKQPAELLDYDIDLSKWLTSGDAPSTATVAITCLTLASDAALLNPTKTVSSTGVKVWLSVGTNGYDYKVEVNTTTTGGRVTQDEFIVKVRNT